MPAVPFLTSAWLSSERHVLTCATKPTLELRPKACQTSSYPPSVTVAFDLSVFQFLLSYFASLVILHPFSSFPSAFLCEMGGSQ